MGQITSMTGFGSGAAEEDGMRVRAVLRSVNGRFLDLSLRCAHGLSEWEPRIRERVQARMSRGKVTGTIDLEESADDAGQPELNVDVASQYLRELRRLAELADTEPPGLEVLARMPGIFRSEAAPPDAEKLEKLLMAAVDQAVEELVQMRVTEGDTLATDLRQRLQLLAQRLEQIETISAGGRDETRRRLREKVDGLLQPGEINEERLATEVVLIAERGDITEEIVRFRSHLEQFHDAIDKGGDVGRRLNFLLQELHREINTISSKASDSAIIHHAVDVKEEVERLREQVQNLA